MPFKSNDFRDLSLLTLANLQNKHRGVTHYILDEMSMIGCKRLALIDKRLKQIHKSNDLFGGKTIILAGDFK